LLVQSFEQPFAYAAATSSPQYINEGGVFDVSAEITYEISTKDVTGRPNISQAIIYVPSGFQISNVQSLLIQDDAANITISNQAIIIDYADDAVGVLPSPNGYDRITFTTLGTPNIPAGLTNTNYTFYSTVSSKGIITGTTHQTNGTNANYPSQEIYVSASDPDVKCHIFPNTLANAIKTNSMTYTVANEGSSYNDIFQLRIKVPTDVISNIESMSSSKGAVMQYDGGTGYIYVYYTNIGALSNGQSDSISFDAIHKITNLNNPAQLKSFNSEADNNNGSGYVASSQDTLTWNVTFVPPDPKGQSYITPNEIWTSIITNTFNVYVYNNGPKGEVSDTALTNSFLPIFTSWSTSISMTLISSENWSSKPL